MEINEILGKLRFMADTYALIPSVCLAAKHTIESQMQRIAELEKDLQLAKKQLKHEGCNTCIYEPLLSDEYPCNGCTHAGGTDSKWEWAKPEVDHEN